MKRKIPKRISVLFLSMALCLTMLSAEVLATEGGASTTSASQESSAVEQVQALIDELPTADELVAMSLEEQQTVYTKVQAAYEAYNALTDEQKAEVTGTEIFDSLFDVFNGMVNTLADGSITEAGITIAYSNGGNAAYTEGSGFQITANGDYVISGTWNGSITGAWTDDRKSVITVSGNITANITIQDLTIDVSGTEYVGAFGIKDNAAVNLTLSDANSLKSGRAIAGLGVGAGTKLTIGGTGSLEAVCADRYGAGIGTEDGNSDTNRNCGDITINSGTIVAIGGKYYPGIGSGVYAEWSQEVTSIITINGGTVTAIGGTNAAGIGGAESGHGSKVIISGGVVTATGGSGAAGIGGGASGIYGNPTQGTFSTGNNGNAVIIVQGGIGDTSNQSNWSGSILVIGGNSGIYGGDSFTLDEDLEILSGNTLNIERGKTLNINNGVTLTNNGSITGYGTLDGSGDLTGTGTIADTIQNNLLRESAVKVKIDPSEAVYGSTVTITAEISKKENALTRAAAQNKVNFYLGTADNGMFLGTADVSNNTATLQVSLNDEKWTVGQHTITAEYGGSMGLKSESGIGTLTVNKADQTGKLTVSVSKTTADSITVSASGFGQGNIQYACVLGENANAPTVGWQTDSTFGGRAAGTAYTVFARYAGNEYYEPSSASDGVTVYTAAKKPAASEVFIDYKAETISFADTLEVNTEEDFSGTNIPSDGFITGYIGNTLYARVKENGNIPASEPLPLAIPSRPAAPSVSVNYGEETLSTTTAMQYASSTSGQSVQRWETCGEDMAATAFGWDGSAEVTVKFRTAATDSTFASAETIVTIPARPEAPAAPVVADRTSSSIEVSVVSGQEYKRGEEEWQTPTGSSIIFDGLEVGESYIIYTRVKATASQFASAEASVTTSTEKPGGSSYTEYTITASAGAGGSISPSGAVRVLRGLDKTFTITPDEGYEVSDILIDGKSMGAASGYTFENVKANHTIEAVFAKSEETLEAEKNARLKAGVENTTIKLKSTLGKGFIRLDWTKSQGYKVDYYEVFKSTKRYEGYGTESYFDTKQGGLTGWYKNTKELKKGTRYYYKVRGVRDIAGETVYTKWSNKAWRLIK